MKLLKLNGNSSTSRGNTPPDPQMCSMLRESANASSRRRRRKKNTSNSAGMKWHTANIIWTNGLQERLQNGQPSLWGNCPINQSHLRWIHYLKLRDLHPQRAKTPPPEKMWRCRTTPHREQWVVRRPLAEFAPSTRKMRLCSMRSKHLRHESSVT